MNGATPIHAIGLKPFTREPDEDDWNLVDGDCDAFEDGVAHVLQVAVHVDHDATGAGRIGTLRCGEMVFVDVATREMAEARLSLHAMDLAETISHVPLHPLPEFAAAVTTVVDLIMRGPAGVDAPAEVPTIQ